MYVIPFPDEIDTHEVALRLGSRKGFVWLDSNASYGNSGRYSYLGSDPTEVVKAEDGESDPFSPLKELTSSNDLGSSNWDVLPLSHIPNWIGYIAYDAFWSGRTRKQTSHKRNPVLWFAHYDALWVVDHFENQTYIVGDNRLACQELWMRLNRNPLSPEAGIGEIIEENPEIHARSIKAALNSIAHGDIYQVNLARCWSASYYGSPLALWLKMRKLSPVPFGMFLFTGDQTILTRTMEQFLRFDGTNRTLTTKPIKGTIKRSGTDDNQTALQLQSDQKERAEHIMIVDLMRNDLGRIAQIGSVKVDQFMKVEPYVGLSHLVSTVSCKVKTDVGLSEIIGATFPPGSVTGTPKLNAIHIIEEQERVPRGIYTGSLGFIDRAGGASLAVAIRTAVIQDECVRYFAGGGLVSASKVMSEIDETVLKARVFLDAVQEIHQQSYKCDRCLRSSKPQSSDHSGVVQG